MRDSEKEINVHQIEFTWWAEDGSERRGRVSIAPDASPDTVAALARMMRLADCADSEETDNLNSAFWLEGLRGVFDGPQEERY